MNILEVIVGPCKPVAAGDCEIFYNGVPTSTIQRSEIATEYFRDYTLEVYLIESSHEVKNFEKPLTKNLR